MNYTLLSLAAVILTLSGLVFYFVTVKRRQQTQVTTPQKTIPLTPPAQLYKLQKSERFWGVTVESHCSASSRLAGIKFPFESAPRLPVRECAENLCKCSFVGLPERRRTADRRRGQDRRNTIRMEATERRAVRPRRQADLVTWQAYRHL